MDPDLMTPKLSEKAKKKYFFNAEEDSKDIFKGIPELVVPKKDEVRQPSEPINIYKHLDDTNAEIEKIRKEAALKSDEFQTLIREPSKQATKTETISIEQLPTIVRQIAENKIAYHLKQGMTTKKR
jgi:hypothetical protein